MMRIQGDQVEIAIENAKLLRNVTSPSSSEPNQEATRSPFGR